METARNSYIDFLKGIAAVGIIAIHTSFYSGQSYMPIWFINLSLFLDVPFFFYLSGWGGSYNQSDIKRTLKSIEKIWLSWIFCISVLAIFCTVSKILPVAFQGVSDFRDLINCYFFKVSIPGFPVVAGSIWFMPIYFVVIILNKLVLMIIQTSEKQEEYKRLYMLLLLVIFVWEYYGNYFFGIDMSILFYSFFYMLGQNRCGRTNNVKQVFGILLILLSGILVTSYLQNLPLYDIQSAKFPPSPKYIFVSMVSIILFKYFEKYQKYFKNKELRINKMLVHIGRNAIFYFVAQGIGSSLLYFYANTVNLGNWIIKYIIAFVLNLICTVIIAELLSFLYDIFKNILYSVFLNIKGQ